MITNLFLSTLVAIGPVARPQLPQLTHNDYVNLAKVIRVEAARNTLDEYCVAASILNRVRSNQFPNTVEKVIYSPGQYEGITFRRNVRPDMNLVRELKSEQGQSYLRKALRIIGNRTDFKGQRMLGYRVPSEDPMCHSKGNFYHYHWQ